MSPRSSVAENPPTPKQFAKTAESATNQWFGGDIALLYRAFGEKPPLQAERVKLVPDDIETFAADVYWALGGTKLTTTSWEAPEPEREAHRQREKRERNRSDLAGRAIEYLQRQEALGRPLTLKEFGRDAFEYRAKSALGADLDQAWAQYVQAIEDSARLHRCGRV